MCPYASEKRSVFDNPCICGFFGITKIERVADIALTVKRAVGGIVGFIGRLEIDCAVGNGGELHTIFAVEYYAVDCIGEIIVRDSV